MGKRGLGLLLFVGVAGMASAAHAASQWRLLYVREAGAESCPDEMELRMAVAARIGRDPFSSSASGAVLARISRHGGELSGHVELVDGSGISRGKRELTAGAATCNEMANAVALSVSIAVDSERAASIEASEAGTDSEPDLLVSPAPVPPDTGPDRGPRPAGPRDPVASVSVSALSLWGVAPTLAWGGAAGFHRRFGWLIAAGRALAVASPEVDVQSGVSLRTVLAAGELELCAARGLLEACAVGLVGVTWARAGQVTLPRTDVGPFLASGGRLGVALPLARNLSLFAEASLLGVAFPVRATVDGVAVWQAPSYAAVLGAGTRFHFQ